MAQRKAAIEMKKSTPIHFRESIEFKPDGFAGFSIKNSGPRAIIFKIKADDVKALEVQPSMAVVWPKNRTNIQVKLRHVAPTIKEEFKLLVQTRQINGGEEIGLNKRTTEELRAMWQRKDDGKTEAHNTEIKASTGALKKKPT